MHLQEHGFEVETRDVPDFYALAVIRADHGVHDALAGCHTAVVDGYVVEGHVPADVIEQMLEERPVITGLAVPGMPEGSPGMEGPNPEPYAVFAFDRTSPPSVYARR